MIDQSTEAVYRCHKSSWAYLSLNGEHFRYQLGRRIGLSLKVACFIALNPSTADETQDDPTIRREAAFAYSWGCGILIKVNLCPLRETSPKEMLKTAPLLKRQILEVNRNFVVSSIAQARESNGKVVVAWGSAGAHKALQLHREFMMDAIGPLTGVECFGLTKNGQPKHPLYLSASTPLVPWVPISGEMVVPPV